MNIRHLKLVNGDELYTEVTDSTETTLVINNPLRVKHMYDPQLGDYMTIAEWIIASKIKTYTINKNHIIVHCSVNTKIEEQYIEYFNSNTEQSHNNKPSPGSFVVIPEDTDTNIQ